MKVSIKRKADGHEGFMVGHQAVIPCASPASGEPCAYPDRTYSCMSAYCIYVKKLAEDCNRNYDYKNKILPFFGRYVFDSGITAP